MENLCVWTFMPRNADGQVCGDKETLMVESELDSSAHVPIETTESIDWRESNQRTLVKTLCVEDPM